MLNILIVKFFFLILFEFFYLEGQNIHSTSREDGCAFYNQVT